MVVAWNELLTWAGALTVQQSVIVGAIIIAAAIAVFSKW